MRHSCTAGAGHGVVGVGSAQQHLLADQVTAAASRTMRRSPRSVTRSKRTMPSRTVKSAWPCAPASYSGLPGSSSMLAMNEWM